MKEFKEVTFVALLLSTCLLTQSTHLGGKFQLDRNFDDIASFGDKGSVVSPTSPKSPTSVSTTAKVTTKVTSITPNVTTKGTSITPNVTTKVTSTTQKITTAKGSTQQPTSLTPSTKSPTSASTTKTTSTTAKPTPPHCLPGQKRPVEGSCKNYTECDKTFNWIQKTCTNWCHNFNPKSLKCDWSWKYQCADSTTTPCTAPTSSATSPTSPNKSSVTPDGGITVAPSSTTEPTTKSTSATTTKAPATCTNGQSKVYQSGDCKDYLQCDSGKWVKKSCSWGFDFDINKLECRWSWWSKC